MKTKAEYEWILKLQSIQSELLMGQTEALSELYRICDTDVQRSLIYSLLERFNYIDSVYYGQLLKKIANYIKNLSYPEDSLAIISLTKDIESDSSQVLLQELKVPIAIAFGRRIPDCNNMEMVKELYLEGYRNFIAVDEFIGSGSTIIERYNRFKEYGYKEATIEFCILAGMQHAIDRVKEKGIKISVFHVMNKAISEYYKDEELGINQECMLQLESKLAEKIGKINLSRHSFGYRGSESIYYKVNGHIPNNVFPIFWWKKYRNGKNRETLFTRVQKDY